MKRKLVGVMIIVLILVNAVDTAFVLKPIFAKFSSDDISNKSPKGNTLTDKTTKSHTAMDFNWDWRSIFERKPQYQWSSAFDRSDYVDGNKIRLIVGVNKYARLDDLEKLANENEAENVDKVSFGGEVRALVFEVPLTFATAFAEKVRSFSFVRYLEPSGKMRAQFVPNDTYWSVQWGPQKIEADWAWNTTKGNTSVLVAVVDTGIDYNHPDLAANYVSGGRDWVSNDDDPKDDFGHGTHCAGIIAAVLNNSVGIAGVAQVLIMAEKVLDSGGYGQWEWVAHGIEHAVDTGADIISMSLGGYGDSILVHEAVKYAYNNGVMVVAAAGNSNTDTKMYPAGYDEVIAVAATDRNDNKASFSNWGDWIELAAPGVDIYSTMPTYHVTLNDYGYAMNYDYLSGTSMACPHVAGLAALVWSLHPEKSRDWLRLWLRYGADDLGTPGFDDYYGYGRINARKAVETPPPQHELMLCSWETPPYLKPGVPGTINSTILNFGEKDETDVEVQLSANGTIVNSTSIDIASGDLAKVSLSWNAMVEGFYNLTLYVVPVLGETNTENNILWRYIYVGSPLIAVVLHSAGNIEDSIITNWQVLSNEWYRFGGTAVYIDYTTLNKENITYADIVASGADVLIISFAYNPYVGWEFTDTEIEAIKNYTYEGHGLIATANTFYPGVPNNNKLAPLFGIKEDITWDYTTTDLLHLLNVSHPLLAGVPNPFVFPMSTTAVPSDMQWDSDALEGGTYLALGNSLESAMVTYKGLVYISPMLEAIPPYYHHHLQLLYNAITWSRYRIPEHDLQVSLQCPLLLRPGKTALVNATVTNMGLHNERKRAHIVLRLLINGQKVAELNITSLVVGESKTISYAWTPTQGTYNMTAYAPPIPGEDEISNNAKMTISRVSSAPAIGFIESHRESLHSEELKGYYEGLGYVVITIRSSITPELLEDINVLIVGEDWNNIPWKASEITAVQDFVMSGRGFVAIGDELAFSVQEILAQYGIMYSGMYGSPGSSSFFDASHPIMNGVTRIYAEAPVNSLRVTSPGYWIASDVRNIATLIAGADSEGYVLCLSDDFAATLYEEDNEIMFANIIPWIATTYDHELLVSLKAYPFAILNATTLISATVYNRGLDDESNVTLQLYIDKILVNTTSIPLPKKSNYTLSYAWKPSVEGTYNITAYAPPVENETYVLNNKATKLVTAARPLINPIEGQYANYTLYYIDPSTGKEIYAGSWNFTYACYVSPYQINVTAYLGGTQSGWMIVNIITRMVEMDNGLYWAGMWYPGWIETDVAIGSTINLVGGSATITGNGIVSINGKLIDCWKILIESYGYEYEFLYDKASGVWLDMKVTSPYQDVHLALTTTNIPLGFTHEHDVTVTIDAPSIVALGKSSVLNATVYNTGLNNETNVTLQLIINGSVVASKVVPDLTVNFFETLGYVWTPTVEGIYNVTAYALPVPNEEYNANNALTSFVRVRWVKGFILFDQTHGADGTYPHQTWIGSLTDKEYVVEAHTYGPITSEVLEKYAVFVIPQPHIDYGSNELSAIQDFVTQGGGLLVIGDDSPEICTHLTSFAGISMYRLGGTGGFTTDITPHPVTAGVYVAYFGTLEACINLTSPATDLIRDLWKDVMLAVSTVGYGKVISIADEDAINDWNIGNGDNLRLAINAIDWLASSDRIPPTINISSPANGTVTKDTSILIQWNATDIGTGIDHYSVYLNNTCVVNNLTENSYTLSNLAEGLNNVTVVAYDKSNNSASGQIVLIVDLASPSVSLVSPARDTYVKGLVQIEMAGNDDNFKNMTLYIDGVLVASYNTPGSNTYIWNTADLEDTQHMLLLEVYDLAENIARTQVQVIADNTAPVGDILQLANMSNVGGILDISVYGHDANLQSMKLFINQSLLYDWRNQNGMHHYAWNTTATEDGVYTAKLVIYDKAGNSFEERLTIIVDNTSPEAHIISPLESAKLKGTVTINFNVTDDNVARVLLYIDSAAFNVTGQTAYTWNSTEVGDGQHVIKIVAIDKAGNVGQAQITVTTTNTSELEQRIVALEIGIIVAIAAATIIILVLRKKRSTTKP